MLNKEATGNVLSQLYQSGYSGRAETGLVGNDDFGIRVSPDGSQWHDALRIESATGMVSFPSGFSAPGGNLLVNPAFLVNQRAYAGTALSTGVYGYDRWKSGAGGSTMNRLADGTISFTGTIEQVVDVAQAPSLVGSSNFAGLTLTFSVENLSAPMPVTIGSMAVTLAEGPGRRSVTVTLDAAHHRPPRAAAAEFGHHHLSAPEARIRRTRHAVDRRLARRRRKPAAGDITSASHRAAPPC